MNETQLEHPNANDLSQFGLGRLDPGASRTIEAHLEVCPDCRGRVEGQADDSLVLLLRSSVQPPSNAATPDPRATLPLPTSAPPAVPSPGDVPADLANHLKYRILDVLGSGGMGTVYRARHLLMERDVALKVVNRALVDSPTLVERFRREVKSAARLDHPHIVRAFDADQAGESHFLVMEYVPGISLARLVAEKGPLPVAEACEYARQAALALQHASEQGMVHRDIKPQNLMRTPAGQIKILDFGLARLSNEVAATAPASPEEGGSAGGSLTQVGAVMGTPDYIAPEQVRDAHAADIRADVYSLGCTLYHLLAGQPPFPDGTSLDKVLAHAERTPRPLQELRPEVPAKVAAVVARMMAKAPRDRYQTPSEAAAALAPFAGSAPVRRRRWTWGLAVLAAVAASLGAAIVTTWQRNPGDPTQGELVVETPENSGLLEFQQQGKRVSFLDLQKDKSCRLKPGDYDLVLKDAPDDLYLPVERCRVTLGTKTTIQVRRAEVVREFRDAPKPYVCLIFTPDGKRLLSGGYDNPLRLWDVATGKEERVFDCPGERATWGIAVAPDGRSVAWGSGSIVRLSDLESGAEKGTFVGHTGPVTSVAFSADGQRLLSGSADGTMRLWDVKKRQQLDGPFLVSRDEFVWSVAFTPAGRHALTLQSVKEKTVVALRLWDLQTRQDTHRLDASRGTISNMAAALSGTPACAPAGRPACASVAAPCRPVTTRCACGTWQPARSCGASLDTRKGFATSPFCRMAGACCRSALMGRRRSGMPRAVNCNTPSPGTGANSRVWPSRAMAGTPSPSARRAWCSAGGCRSRSRTPNANLSRTAFPGRPDRGRPGKAVLQRDQPRHAFALPDSPRSRACPPSHRHPHTGPAARAGRRPRSAQGRRPARRPDRRAHQPGPQAGRYPGHLPRPARRSGPGRGRPHAGHQEQERPDLPRRWRPRRSSRP